MVNTIVLGVSSFTTVRRFSETTYNNSGFGTRVDSSKLEILTVKKFYLECHNGVGTKHLHKRCALRLTNENAPAPLTCREALTSHQNELAILDNFEIAAMSWTLSSGHKNSHFQK